MTPSAPTPQIMIPTTTLLEPSFQDLLLAIERAEDLSERTRQHWACSARQVAKWLNRPPAAIAARWQALRVSMAQLHHARVGVTSKTLANHKSNARAALHWFTKASDVSQRGVRLSPDWARFHAELNSAVWPRVSSLVRYCSARGIGFSDVNDEIFDCYWKYRAETTGLATHNTAKRFMVRAWNDVAATTNGRARCRLTEPPLKMAEPAWNAFPVCLRQEIDAYFAGLAKVHRTLSGKRIRPCSATTIATRRAELVAMARMAVRLGEPIGRLNSLSALLHPDVAEKVIDAYWAQNGEEPKTGTIDLGWKLLRMARETGCLDQTALNRLDDMRVALQEHRREGLTEKNLRLVRQVLTEGVWKEVVSLPDVLMRQARSARDHAPIKAAISAQLAVAIAILTFAPIRLRNLVGIELGQNLIKPAGQNSPYWLVFPHYDVKNRVDLNFAFDEPLADLIDEYVHEFRPTLLRGNNGTCLFPGEAGQSKHSLQFSKQITLRIQKAVGVRITVHQFRHAAAAIYLKNRPGDYETVRRLLGHHDIGTTVRYYCGLETMEATQQFGKLIRQQIKFDADS
ncbi:MAG: site-specific integrase [Bradyrhizobium sp.]|nr:site-specific integrase [Bradyrhizobium sp.]